MKNKKPFMIPVSIFWITTLMYALGLFAIIGMFAIRGSYNSDFSYDKVKINFSIPDEDRGYIYNTINSLKPFYKESIRSLYITNDINHLGSRYFGKNDGSNNIKIYYHDQEQFKTTLCHEICHNFARTEQFCEDLEYTNFCFI